MATVGHRLVRGFLLRLALLLLATTAATTGVVSVQAQQCNVTLPPLEIRGKHWYRSDTGAYVPIKGIGYYPRPNTGSLIGNNIDFFTDTHRGVWERDVAYFAELGVNAVRVYGVDPGGNHEPFLCALAQAGIYLMLDLTASCDNCFLIRDVAPNCYPTALKERGQYVISTFGKYSNVMAFSAGNEINFALGTSIPDYAICQKRFLLDMRRYIAGCDSLRKIPVGVVNADIKGPLLAQYYGCKHEDDDDLAPAEWVGLNQYRQQNYADNVTIPGYEELLADYQNISLSIPVMFTEFGGTSDTYPTIDGYAGQRDFFEVEVLFSPRFAAEFAGGFVFEYSLEKRHVKIAFPFKAFDKSNFGVGYLSPGLCDEVLIPCSYNKFPQFVNLTNRYAAVPEDEPADLGRIGAAVCPSQFAPMSNFTWPTDDPSVGLYCPEYGCPPGGCTAAPASPPVVGTTRPTFSPIVAPAGNAETPSSTDIRTPAPAPIGAPTVERRPAASPAELPSASSGNSLGASSGIKPGSSLVQPICVVFVFIAGLLCLDH
jgi:1,3-beta-glucanosyltransferase GAS5